LYPTKIISFTESIFVGYKPEEASRDFTVSDPLSQPPFDAARPAGAGGADGASAPCHDALDLTRGGTVATICLDEKRYALRITRQRKLILTK
jgi:hypothetical protein